jgi:hypothetical protein
MSILLSLKNNLNKIKFLKRIFKLFIIKTKSYFPKLILIIFLKVKFYEQLKNILLLYNKRVFFFNLNTNL